jgi:hypothetical protein
VEDEHAGAHAKYLRLADELADRWNVPRAAVTPTHACRHGGHPGG